MTVAEENTLHAWLARCVILKIFDSAGVSPLMKMRRQVRKRAGWHDLNNSAVVLYTVRSLLFRSFSFQWSHPERPAERALKFLRAAQRRAATSCAAEFMGEVGGWMVGSTSLGSSGSILLGNWLILFHISKWERQRHAE